MTIWVVVVSFSTPKAIQEVRTAQDNIKRPISPNPIDVGLKTSSRLVLDILGSGSSTMLWTLDLTQAQAWKLVQKVRIAQDPDKRPISPHPTDMGLNKNSTLEYAP